MIQFFLFCVKKKCFFHFTLQVIQTTPFCCIYPCFEIREPGAYLLGQVKPYSVNPISSNICEVLRSSFVSLPSTIALHSREACFKDRKSGNTFTDATASGKRAGNRPHPNQTTRVVSKTDWNVIVPLRQNGDLPNFRKSDTLLQPVGWHYYERRTLFLPPSRYSRRIKNWDWETKLNILYYSVS